MFYSHGGGFSTGSCSSVLQDGANLARQYDVVVVATNHRLGLLGYLYLDELGGEEYAGSGNRGMQDIVAGLEWVGKNIERFGGDPRNVMIFGESGGGAKTCCLYSMPAAAPYFNKASIESGPTLRVLTPEAAQATTDRVLSELGISRQQWRKILDVPAADLLALQMKLSVPPGPEAFGDRRGIRPGALGFAPMVDGKTIPNHPFEPVAPAISRDKPLLVGYNQDEYAFFGWFSNDVGMFRLDEAGLRERLASDLPDYEKALAVYRASRPQASATDLYVAIRSAQFAAAGSIVIAERKLAQGRAPVYAYIFDYKVETVMPGTDHALGAMHALEIPFKFNNVEGPGIGGGPNLAGGRPERIDAARNMSSLWTSFARTGSPTAPGQPAWPSYSLESRSTMIIDAKCRVVNDPGAMERKFWEERAATTNGVGQ
jgi:para-nitrobenzyl esterase